MRESLGARASRLESTTNAGLDKHLSKKPLENHMCEIRLVQPRLDYSEIGTFFARCTQGWMDEWPPMRAAPPIDAFIDFFVERKKEGRKWERRRR